MKVPSKAISRPRAAKPNRANDVDDDRHAAKGTASKAAHAKRAKVATSVVKAADKVEAKAAAVKADVAKVDAVKAVDVTADDAEEDEDVTVVDDHADRSPTSSAPKRKRPS